MYNNQNRRKVLVDEELLRQLLNQVQLPGQRQALVPRQEVMPAEYVLPSEDNVINTGVDRNNDRVPELDLNRTRNAVLDETFHTA